MNRPCWKAVNAQIRKRKAEQAKVEKRIKEEERKRTTVVCLKKADDSVVTIKARHAIDLNWLDELPFEERLETAKNELFKQMKKEIMNAWRLKHEYWYENHELWRAELNVVKGRVFR